MNKYADINSVFIEKGCELLTTRDEFDALPKRHMNIKYRASCGHDNVVQLSSFLYRHTGIICKACVYAGYKTTCRAITDYHSQEYNAAVYIESLLCETFIVKKVVDGCLADYVIKPKENSLDKWLSLQLKVSTGALKYNFCSFNIQHDYANTIILCIHLDNKYIWIFDGNSKLPKKLNISINKASKYNEYLVAESELKDKLIKLYNEYYLGAFDEINKPIAMYQQRELEYRTIRENKIPFVFNYPQIESRVYDFICNEKKCQEKVAGIHHIKNYYIIHLYKNNGTIGKKRMYQQYVKGDNDIYWFHIPDSDVFYVIPENELFIRGYISDIKGQPKKTMILRPNCNSYKNAWANEYVFSYNSLNIDRLRAIL
jgi:hypothetical protein